MYNNYNLNDLFDEFGKTFDVLTRNQDLKLDVVENDDNYLVYVDVPGYDRSDIKLQFEDDTLTINVKEREAKGTILSERSRASAKRSYTFKDVDKESIKANLENGVLLVTLSKRKDLDNVIVIE